VLALALVVTYAVVANRLHRDYAELELKDVASRARGAQRWLSGSATDLSKVVRDWAFWDPMYRHAEKPDATFEAENLKLESISALGLRTMALHRADGSALWAKQSVDGETLQPVSEDFAKFVSRLVADKTIVAGSEAVAGIVSLGGIPKVFATCPVRMADGSGDPIALLTFTRPIGESELTELSTVVGAEATLLAGDRDPGPCESPCVQLDSQSRWLPESSTSGVLRVTVLGWRDWPTYTLELELERHIHVQGVASQRYLALTLLVVGMLLCAAILFQARRLVKQEREQQRAALLNRSFADRTTDAVFLFDSVRGTVVQANARAEALLGLGPGTVARTNPPVDSVLSVSGGSALAMIREPHDGTETTVVRTDGTLIEVELRTSTPIDIDGAALVAVGLRDIGERKAAEKRMWQLAYFDTLTGLPNRFHFQERLQNALAEAKSKHGRVGVMFADLDLFKHINDRHGHAAGDQLLKVIARRLQSCVGPAGVVARQAGDEFLLLLGDVSSEAEIEEVGNRALARIQEPVALFPGTVVQVSGSVGAATYPEHGLDAGALVKGADLAMYEAKARGRGRFALFDPEMKRKADDAADLQSRLAGALERGEFLLHYQPQADAKTGELCGLEALIRWNCPELGMVPPMRFLPIAEESGLIVSIGEWVLREACQQIRSWSRASLHVPRVAVNLSARQLAEADFVDRVRVVLAETGVDPSCVELEITESLAMKNPERAGEVMTLLKASGIAVALDDFGTGYSSLAYLHKFPFDRVKIDRGFVMNLATSQHDQAIVRGVIALAHSLSLEVVAEGVETGAHAALLRSFGCDVLQGYGLSRPINAAAVEELLVQRQPLLPQGILFRPPADAAYL
jgi:diguanylate cyclase (GGDEF)-like protein/PAS domain S-box-containing protein